jgi:hypothetical protein
LLADVPLTAVQRIEHRLDSRFAAVPVLGLDGEVRQRSGRGSHELRILGLLHGATAADDLATLQETAAAGEEVTFAADIATALELQQVVITSFWAAQVAGEPAEVAYELHLAESPPLPPPAQVSGFGGLDDFGFGDLGFDTDILGDLTDLAGQVAGAVSAAMDAIAALEALAGLGDLNFAGPLQPLQSVVDQVGQAGAAIGQAASTLGELFGP